MQVKVLDAVDGDRTVNLKKIQKDLSSIFCDLTYNYDNNVAEYSFNASREVGKLILALKRVQKEQASCQK
jgi:hypothetical protein